MIYVAHTSFDLPDFCIRDIVKAVTHSNLSTDAQYSYFYFHSKQQLKLKFGGNFAVFFTLKFTVIIIYTSVREITFSDWLKRSAVFMQNHCKFETPVQDFKI